MLTYVIFCPFQKFPVDIKLSWYTKEADGFKQHFLPPTQYSGSSCVTTMNTDLRSRGHARCLAVSSLKARKSETKWKFISRVLPTTMTTTTTATMTTYLLYKRRYKTSRLEGMERVQESCFAPCAS